MKKIFLAIACLFVCSFVHAGQNLGQMRYDIRYQINDTTDTSHITKYTDSFLNARINQVQKEICRMTYPLYSVGYITTSSGIATYSISTDTAKIDKVCYLISTTGLINNYQKLTYSTVQSLDVDRGISWESLPVGRPLNFYELGTSIGLVPAPSITYSYANAVKIYYYQIPADMSFDADLPFNGVAYLQDYSNLIVLGVSWKCKKEKGLSWADDYTQYMTILGQMKADVSSMRPDNTTINIQPK